MSLVEDTVQGREAGHSNFATAPAPPEQQTYTDLLDDKPAQAYTTTSEPYDETIYDGLYEMDDYGVMMSGPHEDQSAMEAPVLPQKSALRASRLLDNVPLKLDNAHDTTENGRTLPHDVYLSSEEEASSSADDFSDYSCDSSDECSSQSRRNSHEDTAKLVSVVFSGKPSIIDLSTRRRSVSPTSSDTTRERSSTFSYSMTIDRPFTPSSSISSLHQPSRKSSLLVEVMGKKNPPLLNIDPYANGSTYSLEIPRVVTMSPEVESPVKQQPKTPTKDLFRGVTRTFSLVKKRSRPLLNSFAATQAQAHRSVPASSTSNRARPGSIVMENLSGEHTPSPILPPMSYNDILEAAREKALMAPIPAALPEEPQLRALSPVPPNGVPKRGILSGLAARRRSIKLTGKAS